MAWAARVSRVARTRAPPRRYMPTFISIQMGQLEAGTPSLAWGRGILARDAGFGVGATGWLLGKGDGSQYVPSPNGQWLASSHPEKSLPFALRSVEGRFLDEDASFDRLRTNGIGHLLDKN